DPEIMEGLKRFHANRRNWPPEYQRYWGQRIRPEVWDFVTEAIELKTGRPSSMLESAIPPTEPHHTESPGGTNRFPPVTAATFATEVTDAASPVLVACCAEGCIQCQAALEVLQGLAPQYTGRVKMMALDVAADVTFATELRIRRLPTILLFKGAKL